MWPSKSILLAKLIAIDNQPFIIGDDIRYTTLFVTWNPHIQHTWSSPVHDSLLSLPAHFTIKDLQREQVQCLEAVKFNESHTGDKIASLINSCMLSWSKTEKLTCIIWDNAIYVAGLRDADISNFGVLAQTLHVVINDGVLVQWGVQELFRAACELVISTQLYHSNFKTDANSAWRTTTYPYLGCGYLMVQ